MFARKTADSSKSRASSNSFFLHSAPSAKGSFKFWQGRKCLLTMNEKRTRGNYFTGSECGTPRTRKNLVATLKRRNCLQEMKRPTKSNHAKVKYGECTEGRITQPAFRGKISWKSGTSRRLAETETTLNFIQISRNLQKLMKCDDGHKFSERYQIGFKFVSSN